MAFADDDAMERRLGEYLNGRIGRHLSRREQKESFALYAHGIVGEGERKSVEPIAARATGGVDDDDAAGAACERMQARLLNFLRLSPWNDRSVRREAARYVIEALEKQEPVTTWIIDDTGFPKQGKHSVGVQRQYSGTLGKVGNCQIGVSLTIATKHEHVPIDFALYMPRSWTDDVVRREKARVPADLVFKTKSDLALDLVTHAVEDKIPGDIVLVDAAYGGSSDFRNTVRMFGLDLGVAVSATTKVWALDKDRPSPRRARDGAEVWSRTRGPCVPAAHLARGARRQALLALCVSPRKGRPRRRHRRRRSGADVARNGVARGGGEADEVHPHDVAATHDEERDRAHREGTLAHRARL